MNLRRFFHRRSTGHVGATVDYAEDLREMREAPVDPNLVSDVEADLNWAQAWHHFERSMLDEIDRVFAPILVAAAEFASFEDLREELVSA